MEAPDFNTIKEQYAELREKERRKIIDYLRSLRDANGNQLFTTAGGDVYRYRGGNGIRSYGGLRFKHFDLSNWKYVEAEYRGHYVLISLQSFEIEPTSGNLHVLYDRIGLLFEKPIKLHNLYNHPRVCDAFLKMEVTDWDLPLSESNLKEMKDYITQHFEIDVIG